MFTFRNDDSKNVSHSPSILIFATIIIDKYSSTHRMFNYLLKMQIIIMLHIIPIF